MVSVLGQPTQDGSVINTGFANTIGKRQSWFAVASEYWTIAKGVVPAEVVSL